MTEIKPFWPSLNTSLEPSVDHFGHMPGASAVPAPPLTPFGLQPVGRPGLLLGYAAIDEPAILAGVRRLATALGTVGA